MWENERKIKVRPTDRGRTSGEWALEQRMKMFADGRDMYYALQHLKKYRGKSIVFPTGQQYKDLAKSLDKERLSRDTFDLSLFWCSECNSSYSETFLQAWNMGYLEGLRAAHA